MIQVEQVEELPASVPASVRHALTASVELMVRLHTADVWAAFPGIVLRFRQRPGHPRMEVDMLELEQRRGDVAARTDDLMRDVMRHRRLPHRPGAHLGTAVLTEGLTLDTDEPEPSGSPEQIAAQYADLVATGRGRQFHTTVGSLASGWRFEIEWARHDAAHRIRVFEPGAQWPGEADHALLAPLAALDNYLARS